ncbi:hypothetical protein NN6n1_02220 [Shinella zoogloeoides]
MAGKPAEHEKARGGGGHGEAAGACPCRPRRDETGIGRAGNGMAGKGVAQAVVLRLPVGDEPGGLRVLREMILDLPALRLVEQPVDIGVQVGFADKLALAHRGLRK